LAPFSAEKAGGEGGGVRTNEDDRKKNLDLCHIYSLYGAAVNFAAAASQNGFSTYTLFLHRKTIIIQKMAKNIRFFY
jgi:hypothetical protein